MPIEPKDFMLYWLGAFVVLALFLFKRPKKGGVTLRLLGVKKTKDLASPRTATGVVERPAVSFDARRERPLNVIFQYNGHSWDAYEVLGVPAGSSYETVKAAYLESLASVDQTSKEFVQAAFRAIDAASLIPN